ncbi:hypothetical protein BGZ79_003000, partial [Entomortierella chlamydospora]
MTPVLERILTGKETSPFILVKDTLEQSGQILGLELLKKTPSDHTIILVCAETAPDQLVSLVKGEHCKIVVDCYSDPLGWTDAFQSSKTPSGASSIFAANLSSMKKVSRTIIDIISRHPNFAIYFDSLSQFLLASVPDTFNLIRSITGLLTDTSRIIAIHHEDIPDADSFSPDASKPLASNSLAHIATTLITIKNSEAIRQDQDDLRRGVVTAKEFSYLSVHGNAWDSA